MKKIQLTPLKRNLILIMVIPFLIFSLNACTRKTTFQSSSVVPAAQGTVKVKKDGNKNYVIKVQLANLAESSRLQPPKEVYIVWMETDNNSPKNIGQIKSSSNFMSKNLKASFETVSSSKPTKIFLTAEDNESVQYPVSQVVMTTGNF